MRHTKKPDKTSLTSEQSVENLCSETIQVTEYITCYPSRRFLDHQSTDRDCEGKGKVLPRTGHDDPEGE